MRTTVSACAWLVLVGLSVACSSKSDGGSTSMGGSGTVLGSSGSSTAGSSATSAGSGGSGTTTNGGSGGGSALDDCLNAPLVCVDAMNASTCNPATGMDETFNCAAESVNLGFTSNGCSTDPEFGDGCTIDMLNDADCAAGYAPWGICNGYGPESAVDIYVACFLDDAMLRAPIICYGKYYDAATDMLDCVGATAECDAL
jgi:hypothetical protein